MAPGFMVPSSPLLADRLAASLSVNATLHLRAAAICCDPALTMPREALRAKLLLGGFPAPEAVLDVESRLGGAVFRDGLLVGFAGILLRSPWIQARNLPRLGDVPLLPVVANPAELTEDWEGPVFVLNASGALLLYEAPVMPVPAYDSVEQFLEMAALGPLEPEPYVLRVDAFCGDLVAGLAGAILHPPACGRNATAWIGPNAWVKELRIGEGEKNRWSLRRGTHLLTRELGLAVEAASLLLAEGYSLGYRGPAILSNPEGPEVLSFLDAYPETGFLSHAEISVRGTPGSLTVFRQVRSGPPPQPSARRQ